MTNICSGMKVEPFPDVSQGEAIESLFLSMSLRNCK